MCAMHLLAGTALLARSIHRMVIWRIFNAWNCRELDMRSHASWQAQSGLDWVDRSGQA